MRTKQLTHTHIISSTMQTQRYTTQIFTGRSANGCCYHKTAKHRQHLGAQMGCQQVQLCVKDAVCYQWTCNCQRRQTSATEAGEVKKWIHKEIKLCWITHIHWFSEFNLLNNQKHKRRKVSYASMQLSIKIVCAAIQILNIQSERFQCGKLDNTTSWYRQRKQLCM